MDRITRMHTEPFQKYLRHSANGLNPGDWVPGNPVHPVHPVNPVFTSTACILRLICNRQRSSGPEPAWDAQQAPLHVSAAAPVGQSRLPGAEPFSGSRLRLVEDSRQVVSCRLPLQGRQRTAASDERLAERRLVVRVVRIVVVPGEDPTIAHLIHEAGDAA